MATFNIDQMKSNFEPVEIVFRGETYLLGRDALGLLDACDMHGELEKQDGVKYMRALLQLLPRMVHTLCPTLELPEDLETGEQMALVVVCTEVLGRVARMSFPAQEQ